MGTTLVEHAAQQLVALIKNQRLGAGDKLPTESELTELLAVGRGTVREAVKVLTSRNILEVRQGSGIFVSAKGGVPEDPLGLTLLAHQDKIALDLLDIRLMIEPELASMAAVRRTPEQLCQLQAQCQAVEQLILAGAEYGKEDVCFHQILAQCSGNLVVGRLVPIINSSVYASIDLTENLNARDTVQEHRAIVAAVERHDFSGARWAMTVHLNTSRSSMIQRLDGKVQ